MVLSDCEYSENRGEKDKPWDLPVKVLGDIQQRKIDKHVDNDKVSSVTPEEECRKKPVLSNFQSGVRNVSGERYIYVNGCEYVAKGTIVPLGDGAAADWTPTGEVAEGTGYGRKNNNGQETLAHSFCESQYGTYGDIITSDDYVVTDRCKPVFKENKFLGWAGSGAYSGECKINCVNGILIKNFL